tara:strand:- start:380 stop:520 length:141 start_codon:yes stop_codon:yes gene_type:complete
MGMYHISIDITVSIDIIVSGEKHISIGKRIGLLEILLGNPVAPQVM